jgi:putative MATE family efflux protein
MLLVIAATGLMRGLQDTRTPLWVAGGGFGANIVLNAVFIYGLGWGIAGSALGTVLAQAGMAAVLVVIAFRAARRYGASLRPHGAGVWASAATSGWLLVRSAALRAALILLILQATALGTTQLAAVQVAQTLFFALALALDALAIAGQALIALRLGAEDVPGVQRITGRLVRWGLGFGLVCAVAIAAGSPWIPAVFTQDPAVADLLTSLLLVFAVSLPLAGVVFVLDGVLMGAEDARYLALAQVASLAVYAALLLIAMHVWPHTLTAWAAFAVGFLGARGVTLALRARGRRWIDRALALGIR